MSKSVAQKAVLEGRVVSDKMNKTIVVEVERTFKHPVYGKIIKKNKKYKVHDPEEVCNIGDFVKIKQTNPISKTKNMILDRVIKASSVEV